MPGPDAAAQLQENILIANNAVYSSGAGGISVTNSREVTIMDNIITDSDANSYGDSSIYLNAVSEGVSTSHGCLNLRVHVGAQDCPSLMSFDRHA